MKAIMLLFTLAATIFRAPDAGGTTGGESESTGKTAQDVAKENADLAERCAEAGIDVPAFPAGPAGLEKAREFMRNALEKKDGDSEAEDADTETAEQLVEGNTKEELLSLAEEEDVEVSSSGTKQEIAEAIVAARAKKTEGTTGSTQSGDA